MDSHWQDGLAKFNETVTELSMLGAHKFDCCSRDHLQQWGFLVNNQYSADGRFAVHVFKRFGVTNGVRDEKKDRVRYSYLRDRNSVAVTARSHAFKHWKDEDGKLDYYDGKRTFVQSWEPYVPECAFNASRLVTRLKGKTQCEGPHWFRKGHNGEAKDAVGVLRDHYVCERLVRSTLSSLNCTRIFPRQF